VKTRAKATVQETKNSRFWILKHVLKRKKRIVLCIQF